MGGTKVNSVDKMAESETMTRTKHEMVIYCKRLLEVISSLNTETPDDVESKLVLEAYRERFINLHQHFDDQSSKFMTEAALFKCLQAIAQLVLDVTFLVEQKLVDEDFSKNCSFCRVWNVIGILQSIEDLASRTVPDKPISDVLSSEIIECIQWRKGALLYMYCHTLNSQLSVESMPPYFGQCLEAGIKFLTSMLCTRSSPKWLTDAMSNKEDSEPEHRAHDDDDDDTGVLLAQGILSDTHLLALMYCGEMCYWHTCLHQPPGVSKYTQDAKLDDPSRDTGMNPVESCSITDCSTVSTDRCGSDPSFVSDSLKSSIGDNKVSSHTCLSATEKCKISVSGVAFNAEMKIDFVKIGKLCLENYIGAARGPLEIGGWKTTRAEEILQYFGNLKQAGPYSELVETRLP